MGSGTQPRIVPSLPRSSAWSRRQKIVWSALVILAVAVAATAALILTAPPPSARPNVHLRDLRASALCPPTGLPTVTFAFTLINSGNADAEVQVVFYLERNVTEPMHLVGATYYPAPAGSTRLWTQNVTEFSCPPTAYMFDIYLNEVRTLE